MKRPHKDCPVATMEERCPFRFICGQPCTFRSNTMFWAVVAVFFARAGYDIVTDGWDRSVGVFLALGMSLVLWAVFQGFKK